MGKKVSRNEAAKILGCTSQTVANYAASGLIDEISRATAGGKVSFFYDEEQLKKLTPDLTNLSTLRGRISEEQAALDAELKALQEKKEALKEERLLLSSDLYRADSYRKLIADTWAFAFRAYPDLDRDRYRQLIDAIVEGKSAREISDKLAVSYERVKQILTKMGNQLAARTGLEDLLEQYQKENRELSAKVKVLTAQIEAGGLDSSKVESAATMPLKSIGISVRTYNILHHTLGFSTLGEVATMTKEQLRMTRNLGRKSYSEILQVLEYHGLTLKDF